MPGGRAMRRDRGLRAPAGRVRPDAKGRAGDVGPPSPRSSRDHPGRRARAPARRAPRAGRRDDVDDPWLHRRPSRAVRRRQGGRGPAPAAPSPGAARRPRQGSRRLVNRRGPLIGRASPGGAPPRPPPREGYGGTRRRTSKQPPGLRSVPSLRRAPSLEPFQRFGATVPSWAVATLALGQTASLRRITFERRQVPSGRPGQPRLRPPDPRAHAYRGCNGSCRARIAPPARGVPSGPPAVRCP